MRGGARPRLGAQDRHRRVGLPAPPASDAPLCTAGWAWDAPCAGPSVAHAIGMGATAPGRSRRLAARVPEMPGPERRRTARKTAPQPGAPPSQAPRPWCARQLVLPQVPQTLGTAATGVQGSPGRGHSAMLLPSWPRSRPYASRQTKKDATTCGALEGRMRGMVGHDARGPQRRTTRGGRPRRARSVRQRVRHGPACAARWRQVLWQSEIAMSPFLTPVCATAERWVGQASRKRRPTAQRLRESVSQHRESAALAMVINASLHAYAGKGAPPSR